MTLEERRLRIDEKLKSISNVKKVYYSPPNGTEMEYPCITYKLNGSSPKHADNIPYLLNLEWSVTVIDEDPDSKIASDLMNSEKYNFITDFKSDDLNHFVFTLYG